MDGPVPNTVEQSCNYAAQCCAYCQREFASLHSTIDGFELGNAQRDDGNAQLSQRVQEQSAALESLWELVWELQPGRAPNEALQETDPSRPSGVVEEEDRQGAGHSGVPTVAPKGPLMRRPRSSSSNSSSSRASCPSLESGSLSDDDGAPYRELIREQQRIAM